MIKITALYQISGYKIPELKVESELISNSYYYDPINISRSSNSVMVEERTHSRAREQPPSRVRIKNMDVDADEK
jgi:hypothetical protein